MATRSPSLQPPDQEQPLLSRSGSSRRGNGARRPSLRGAARFLTRASSRRVMREPSQMVRETAADHLEDRHNDWAYSTPVVAVDIVWNLVFVAVAGAVLTVSRRENPAVPLRIWIVGYAAQCVLHITCVWVEYRKRYQPRPRPEDVGEGSHGGAADRVAEDDSEYEVSDHAQVVENDSVAKHLESFNTMFSFIWWIIGFYWVSAGGQTLAQDAPQLYWLCIVFLAFDVFFVVFCVVLACVVGIAVCCCLPCIIALLYAVADQEGASDEDIRQLPRYKFRMTGDFDTSSAEASGRFGGTMTKCGKEISDEYFISAEDAECCICLSAYADGAELLELPCNHHFHCACIEKWLHINATCPLCKYNIMKVGNSGIEEV